MQNEDIETKLTKELARWLGVQEEELIMDIDKIFRINSERTNSNKGSGTVWSSLIQD